MLYQILDPDITDEEFEAEIKEAELAYSSLPKERKNTITLERFVNKIITKKINQRDGNYGRLLSHNTFKLLVSKCDEYLLQTP